MLMFSNRLRQLILVLIFVFDFFLFSKAEKFQFEWLSYKKRFSK